MSWQELPDSNPLTGEGFCWHKMVSVGYGPRAVGEEGMAWRTTRHPQECRITRKHLTFCNGSNQAYFRHPQVGCIASIT